MQKFFAAAPGALWVALIVGLVAGAAWLTQYYSNLSWVPPVAGLIATVLVPVLKVLAENQNPPAMRDMYADSAPQGRSALSRWLL